MANNPDLRGFSIGPRSSFALRAIMAEGDNDGEWLAYRRRPVTRYSVPYRNNSLSRIVLQHVTFGSSGTPRSGKPTVSDATVEGG